MECRCPCEGECENGCRSFSLADVLTSSNIFVKQKSHSNSQHYLSQRHSRSRFSFSPSLPAASFSDGNNHNLRCVEKNKPIEVTLRKSCFDVSTNRTKRFKKTEKVGINRHNELFVNGTRKKFEIYIYNRKYSERRQMKLYRNQIHFTRSSFPYFAKNDPINSFCCSCGSGNCKCYEVKLPEGLDHLHCSTASDDSTVNECHQCAELSTMNKHKESDCIPSAVCISEQVRVRENNIKNGVSSDMYMKCASEFCENYCTVNSCINKNDVCVNAVVSVPVGDCNLSWNSKKQELITKAVRRCSVRNLLSNNHYPYICKKCLYCDPLDISLQSCDKSTSNNLVNNFSSDSPLTPILSSQDLSTNISGLNSSQQQFTMPCSICSSSFAFASHRQRCLCAEKRGKITYCKGRQSRARLQSPSLKLEMVAKLPETMTNKSDLLASERKEGIFAKVNYHISDLRTHAKKGTLVKTEQFDVDNRTVSRVQLPKPINKTYSGVPLSTADVAENIGLNFEVANNTQFPRCQDTSHCPKISLRKCPESTLVSHFEGIQKKSTSFFKGKNGTPFAFRPTRRRNIFRINYLPSSTAKSTVHFNSIFSTRTKYMKSQIPMQTCISRKRILFKNCSFNRQSLKIKQKVVFQAWRPNLLKLFRLLTTEIVRKERLNGYLCHSSAKIRGMKEASTNMSAKISQTVKTKNITCFTPTAESAGNYLSVNKTTPCFAGMINSKCRISCWPEGQKTRLMSASPKITSINKNNASSEAGLLNLENLHHPCKSGQSMLSVLFGSINSRFSKFFISRTKTKYQKVIKSSKLRQLYGRKFFISFQNVVDNAAQKQSTLNFCETKLFFMSGRRSPFRDDSSGCFNIQEASQHTLNGDSYYNLSHMDKRELSMKTSQKDDSEVHEIAKLKKKNSHQTYIEENFLCLSRRTDFASSSRKNVNVKINNKDFLNHFAHNTKKIRIAKTPTVMFDGNVIGRSLDDFTFNVTNNNGIEYSFRRRIRDSLLAFVVLVICVKQFFYRIVKILDIEQTVHLILLSSKAHSDKVRCISTDPATVETLIITFKVNMRRTSNKISSSSSSALTNKNRNFWQARNLTIEGSADQFQQSRANIASGNNKITTVSRNSLDIPCFGESSIKAVIKNAKETSRVCKTTARSHFSSNSETSLSSYLINTALDRAMKRLIIGCQIVANTCRPSEINFVLIDLTNIQLRSNAILTYFRNGVKNIYTRLYKENKQPKSTRLNNRSNQHQIKNWIDHSLTTKHTDVNQQHSVKRQEMEETCKASFSFQQRSLQSFSSSPSLIAKKTEVALWRRPCNVLVFLFAIMLSLSTPGSACPSSCVCKWKGGKMTAECVNKGMSSLPVGLDHETQVLDFTGNALVILAREKFKILGLTNLQRIYVSRCKLVQLDDAAFRGLSNLVELDLSNNELNMVPASALEHTTALMRLLLSHNPITKIKDGAFGKLNFLMSLEMTGCTLQTLEPKAFQGLDKLEWLKLDDNQLTTVPQTMLLPKMLHGVDLHNNPWHCDCKLQHLRSWLVKYNVPSSIEPKCATPVRLETQVIKHVFPEEFACAPEVRPTSLFLDVLEGKNVSFACHVSAEPSADIEWKFNGHSLQNSSFIYDDASSFFIYEDKEIKEETVSYLKIEMVTESHGGVFQCAAENTAGKMISNFTLRVSVPPTVQVPKHFIENNFRYFGIALVGLSSLVVILCFILICKCCRRRKKKKPLNVNNAASECNVTEKETEKSSNQINCNPKYIHPGTTTPKANGTSHSISPISVIEASPYRSSPAETPHPNPDLISDSPVEERAKPKKKVSILGVEEVDPNGMITTRKLDDIVEEYEDSFNVQFEQNMSINDIETENDLMNPYSNIPTCRIIANTKPYPLIDIPFNDMQKTSMASASRCFDGSKYQISSYGLPNDVSWLDVSGNRTSDYVPTNNTSAAFTYATLRKNNKSNGMPSSNIISNPKYAEAYQLHTTGSSLQTQDGRYGQNYGLLVEKYHSNGTSPTTASTSLTGCDCCPDRKSCESESNGRMSGDGCSFDNLLVSCSGGSTAHCCYSEVNGTVFDNTLPENYTTLENNDLQDTVIFVGTGPLPPEGWRDSDCASNDCVKDNNMSPWDNMPLSPSTRILYSPEEAYTALNGTCDIDKRVQQNTVRQQKISKGTESLPPVTEV